MPIAWHTVAVQYFNVRSTLGLGKNRPPPYKKLESNLPHWNLHLTEILFLNGLTLILDWSPNLTHCWIGFQFDYVNKCLALELSTSPMNIDVHKQHIFLEYVIIIFVNECRIKDKYLLCKNINHYQPLVQYSIKIDIIRSVPKSLISHKFRLLKSHCYHHWLGIITGRCQKHTLLFKLGKLACPLLWVTVLVPWH